MKKWIKGELEDYRILLRNVPSLVTSLFVVSVIMMNLLANKELFSFKYLALDCGFALSWVSFLCMDMLCKRFGGKAAAKIAILALVINLGASLIFKALTMTPGMWGEYYSTGSMQVNDALNTTIGGPGTWFWAAAWPCSCLPSAMPASTHSWAKGSGTRATGISPSALSPPR